MDFVRGLVAAGRRPRLVVIENVLGLLTSSGRADFQAIVGTLLGMGYRCGGMVVDAASCVPQSRQRVFLIAVAADLAIPAGLAAPGPVPRWHPKTLVQAALPFSRWLWLMLPEPPVMKARLSSILETKGVIWHSIEERDGLLALMTAEAAEDLELAREGEPFVGTLTKRTRPVLGGRRQRAELRLDGFAGCLRTPTGGSSQQALVAGEPACLRTRLLTTRECARLMGVQDGYSIPENRLDALRLLGDGLVVPVVQFVGDTLLTPLLGGSQVHFRIGASPHAGEAAQRKVARSRPNSARAFTDRPAIPDNR